MSFPFFNSFPLEIQALIQSQCEPNDRACLSLTCKILYKLNHSNRSILLSNQDDLEPLCPCSKLSSAPSNPWRSRYQHRSECHDASFAEKMKRNEKLGLPVPKAKKCRTDRWASHCECFSGQSKLYQRLRTWVPKGLNYCKDCNMFTRRKKAHNGRCYHGHPKPRHQKPNFWTHHSRRGAFGRKLWKKWFNNAHMNHLESRLGAERSRAGKDRYAMRILDPKHVDTRDIRCGY